MKTTWIRTALATSVCAVCLSAFAQQAPVSPNAPNPSAPPMEGQKPESSGMPAASDKMSRGDQMGGQGAMDHQSKSKHSKSMNKRSSKPRQKDASPSPTAESPSGPKGDSPDPATK